MKMSASTLIATGAGFDPQLSGRENLYLNAAILGMSRAETQRKFDEIVDFAGIRDFIELPMRTYSSGMTARLKFAIATAREHDILIVDEALAVGDKTFRKRSEARIRDIRDNAGTVFLVSHSMQSIRDTCNRVIWINKGQLVLDGKPDEVIEAYEESMH